MLTWKKTASPWPDAARWKDSVVAERMLSDVKSPAAWSTTFRQRAAHSLSPVGYFQAVAELQSSDRVLVLATSSERCHCFDAEDGANRLQIGF